MGIFSKLSGGESARAEALRLGLKVTQGERDVPHFDGKNRLGGLSRWRCVEYSLRREPAEGPAYWSFLQRTKDQGAQYSNGWLFSSAEGPAPMPLDQLLKRIADEWVEEYLEFEATPVSVSAFWEEWGGAKTARRLYETLLELSRV